MTQILQTAVISLFALPCPFQQPNSFAKPPRFSVCNSGHANRSEALPVPRFVFECRSFNVGSVGRMAGLVRHYSPYCPPVRSPAGFISLIHLRSLLLDFPCATAATQAPATPIAPDRLFFNVRSVGRMARPPYCPPVPSPACFIRLILLQSLTLDLPCPLCTVGFQNSTHCHH